METQASWRRALRILAIDDEPFVLTLTVHVLQQSGFQHITTACDGAAALHAIHAAESPFDLVICDLNMPVMDGYDFMRGAQAIGYRGAVVVLSSETSDALGAAYNYGKKCGLNMLGTLAKPLEAGQLIKLLETSDI